MSLIEAGSIGAYRNGNDVYIPRGPLKVVMENYFHEAGHIMSDHLSYYRGDVLLPSEARQKTPWVNFTTFDFADFLGLFFFSGNEPIDPYKIDVIKPRFFDRLLFEFSKFQFNASPVIRLHYGMSYQELLEIVKTQTPRLTVSLDSGEEKEVSAGNSLIKRSDGGLEFAPETFMETMKEVAPIYTSAIGGILCTNYINYGMYNFLGLPLEQRAKHSFREPQNSESANHGRAYKWVYEAMTANQPVLSMKDIENAVDIAKKRIPNFGLGQN